MHHAIVPFRQSLLETPGMATKYFINFVPPWRHGDSRWDCYGVNAIQIFTAFSFLDSESMGFRSRPTPLIFSSFSKYRSAVLYLFPFLHPSPADVLNLEAHSEEFDVGPRFLTIPHYGVPRLGVRGGPQAQGSLWRRAACGRPDRHHGQSERGSRGGAVSGRALGPSPSRQWTSRKDGRPDAG